MTAPPAPHRSSALPPEQRARASASRGHVRHILYVAGTGNVARTYRHWLAGRDEPGIPSIAYSQQVYELAEALGARLTVLASGQHEPPPEGPVRFEHVPRRRRKGLLFHLDEIAYAFGVLARARRAGVDTVLMQANLVHYWPLALAPLFGIGVIYSQHTAFWPAHRPPGRRERLIGWLNGFAFRRARGVVAVSEAIAAQVRQMAGAGRVRTLVQVPQYRDRFADLPRPSRAGEGVRLIYVGRVLEGKGIFELLEAFARLAERYPSLSLEYVGEGRDLARLRAAAEALPHGGRVRFSGQLGGVEVFERLAAADVLVCPTGSGVAEGLAKTPIEAALAGLPSVVTSVVPAADLLAGAVRVVPPDDVDALAEALGALVSDAGLRARMASAARTRARLFFDRRHSLASRLLELIDGTGIPS